MRNQNTVVIFLVFVLLGSSLSGASYAQEKGQWRLIEDKDAMTDQVTSVLVLSEKTIGRTSSAGQLSVGKTAGRNLVALTLPMRLSAPTITVQWRIDDSPMVEEQWAVSEKTIGPIDNQRLLKGMVAGKRLRVRFPNGGTAAEPVLEYDIRGLSYYLPKMGIATDK